MLFGALLAVPATMFVSCKDYDDDITEVRGEITTSATDLSSLVEEKMKNVKTEISALTGAFSGSEEAAPAPEPEKALTLEEVRAILAEKSRDGFTAQIRDLLLKYGAKKLSEVDPASYKALVADAEVLGNG